MTIAFFCLLALCAYPIWCVFAQRHTIADLSWDLRMLQTRYAALDDDHKGIQVRYEKRNTERARLYDAQLMEAIASRDRYREEVYYLKGVIQSVPAVAAKKKTAHGKAHRRNTKRNSD